MGVHHGGYCVGCCWVLIGLLFVVGVMNLLWVVVVTAFVLIEKIASGGYLFARAASVLFVAAGAYVNSQLITTAQTLGLDSARQTMNVSC